MEEAKKKILTALKESGWFASSLAEMAGCYKKLLALLSPLAAGDELGLYIDTVVEIIHSKTATKENLFEQLAAILPSSSESAAPQVPPFVLIVFTIEIINLINFVINLFVLDQPSGPRARSRIASSRSTCSFCCKG